MTKTHSFTWRKGIAFSATFLFIALVSVACKKKENLIGTNNINQNDLLASNGQDTFALKTYTIAQDSVSTKNNLVTLLGSYVDPTFGNVNAGIFTELQLQSVSPDFGDLSTVVVDSFVLGLVYSGYYGKTGDQTIQVFEIADGIQADSSYYQFSSMSSNTVNLVASGQGVMNMNPDNVTIIDSNEVPSQLRIHLDPAKAFTIMEDSQLLPASFETTEAFSDYFKGLHIRTANLSQSSGDGGVFYFNMKAASSKMTIYYTLAGEKKTYDFYINAETTHFNNVLMDNNMTRVQDVIDNPTLGQQDYYAQAFRSRAVIEMPTISDIKPNAVVHSAVMKISVSHQTGVEYKPAGAISVSRENPDEPGTYIGIGNAVYSSVSKQYSFDLRFHVQRVVSGEIENTPLVVTPLFFTTSADRIIFNGPETVNKVPPSLRILYTEF